MQIPGYRVIRKINQGGMSTVYLAIQKSVGREVALKVMSPALNADPVFSERFQREANIVGQLSHPNIIAIYDIGCYQNLNYIAMDYLPGGTIHDKMKIGISTENVLKITKEIAIALNVAHNKWFVHRDIKPENVLFRSDGTAVLTDFGVAKAVSSSINVTNVGTVVGTPYYMSPEQARGLPLDRRSDLYSLGIVFYEMLTGSVPFKADEAVAIAIKHLTQPIPSLPAQYSIYQHILNKLLAKKPDDRFQSGLELVAAIDHLQATLSGSSNNSNTYTDPSSMSVMTLFKALVLTSYAALRLKAKNLIEKILHWRWTPNRGFYRRPNVKVTEIRTEVDSGEINRATIISTRVQKATHYEESIGGKFSYVTRAFTWLFILSIIWSSLSVGMTRMNMVTSKIVPIKISEAMQSTAGVIENYSTRMLGEKETHSNQITDNTKDQGTNQSTKDDSQSRALIKKSMLAEQLSSELEDLESQRMIVRFKDLEKEEEPIIAAESLTIGLPELALPIPEVKNPFQEDPSAINIDLPQNINTLVSEDNNDFSDIASAESLLTKTSEENITPAKPKPRYAFTIKSTPKNAKIRILNIKAKYKAKMPLPSGKYKVEISKSGYETIVDNVTVKNKPLSVLYTLKKILIAGDSFTDTLKSGATSPVLVIIPTGSFIMGKKEENKLSPEHKVIISKPLAVSKYEITFSQYQQFANATGRPIPNDNNWGEENRPVINVNWNSAIAYTEWLSKETGHIYRLPSEAEWEYFSRAGTTSDYWWGNDADNKAHCKRGCGDKFSGDYKNKTAPVGRFPSNPFLIYDTSGNVAEWTLDCYKNNYDGAPTNGKPVGANNCKNRTIRGGSFKDKDTKISNPERRGLKASATEEFVGFRVVRELEN